MIWACSAVILPMTTAIRHCQACWPGQLLLAHMQHGSNILLQDPEIISRLLVAGNDAVQQAAEKFMAKRDMIIQEDSRQSPPPGWG